MSTARAAPGRRSGYFLASVLALSLAEPAGAQTGPSAVDPTTINLAYAQSLAGSGQVIEVTSSIQAAVNSASPGDVIFIPPGTYNENVQVRTGGLTVVGPSTAVLNGTGLTGRTGIDVRPPDGATQLSGFNLVGLTIQNYERNGVVLRGVDNYQLLSGTYTSNLQYGLFPIRSTNGLIEGNTVSGANDAGIYVGQSQDAIIRGNTAFDNTIGIEIENSIGIEARGNTTTGNSVGLLGVVLPGLSVTSTNGLVIADNVFSGNNRINPVTDPTDILSRLPYGIGLLFIGTDQTSVFANTLLGNGSIGLGLVSLPADVAALDPRINAQPDYNQFINNLVVGNGLNPDPRLAALGFVPADILWDGTGVGNGFGRNQFGTSVPGRLPAAVPEPSTWWMMLAGFGAIGFVFRRARNPSAKSGSRGPRALKPQAAVLS